MLYNSVLNRFWYKRRLFVPQYNIYNHFCNCSNNHKGYILCINIFQSFTKLYEYTTRFVTENVVRYNTKNGLWTVLSFKHFNGEHWTFIANEKYFIFSSTFKTLKTHYRLYRDIINNIKYFFLTLISS